MLILFFKLPCSLTNPYTVKFIKRLGKSHLWINVLRTYSTCICPRNHRDNPLQTNTIFSESQIYIIKLSNVSFLKKLIFFLICNVHRLDEIYALQEKFWWILDTLWYISSNLQVDFPFLSLSQDSLSTFSPLQNMNTSILVPETVSQQITAKKQWQNGYYSTWFRTVFIYSFKNKNHILSC